MQVRHPNSPVGAPADIVQVRDPNSPVGAPADVVVPVGAVVIGKDNEPTELKEP